MCCVVFCRLDVGGWCLAWLGSCMLLLLLLLLLVSSYCCCRHAERLAAAYLATTHAPCNASIIYHACMMGLGTLGLTGRCYVMMRMMTPHQHRDLHLTSPPPIRRPSHGSIHSFLVSQDALVDDMSDVGNHVVMEMEMRECL